MINYLDKKELPQNCYLFKHSTRCPVSSSAAERIKAMTLKEPLYWINVVEQRELSSWVAETYEIVHESPQLIYIADGTAVDSWSHSSIQEEAVNARE